MSGPAAPADPPDNDALVRAGTMHRYTRSCAECGQAFHPAALPAPSRCAACAPPATLRPEEQVA